MNVRSRFLTKRALGWGAAFAVLAVLLVLAFRSPAVGVDLEEVVRGVLVVTVEDEGRTRVRHRFLVTAPAAGKLLRAQLEPGEAVRRDETVVAVLEPAESAPLDPRSRAEAVARRTAAEATLAQAGASLAEAQAQLEYDRAEATRLSRLASEEIVAAERAQRAETTARAQEERARAARFAVDAARAELARARAVLSVSGGGGDPVELVAPIDGAVLQRFRESESFVAAGESILELGDVRELEVIADFLSTDAVQVAPGSRAWIDRWGGGGQLAAEVRRVEPFGFTKISALGVEEQRVNVLLDLTAPAEEWRSLGDGYRVEVAIVVWEQTDVLKVPTSSLFRHGDGWAVWTVAGGRATLRPVELGRRGSVEAQVVSGIEAGEQVVEFPSDSIEQGVRVEPR